MSQPKLREGWIEIGDGHAYKFFEWSPDMSIPENAGRFGHLSVLMREWPIAGAIVRHPCRTETGLHEGVISFRTPLTEAHPKGFRPTWEVKSWEPLHVEPSLLSHCPCKDHGFIRGDRWVRA